MTNPCDLNGDGVCNFDDLWEIEMEIEAGNAMPQEALDYLTAAPNDGLGTVLGDVNLDFKFDSDDLIEIFAAGIYNVDERAKYVQGDYNFDQRFDSDDLIEAFATGNYQPADATAAVPEPASFTLAALAMLALLRRRGL